jgi:hypothetical protein
MFVCKAKYACVGCFEQLRSGTYAYYIKSSIWKLSTITLVCIALSCLQRTGSAHVGNLLLRPCPWLITSLTFSPACLHSSLPVYSRAPGQAFV